MARPALSAVTELFKPITWFPPMWAFACGVVASGVPLDGRWLLAVVGMLLAGPLVCATSQAVNDWFDRHVDAINEPQRPIPSGRMPGRWGLYVAIVWTAVSLAVATVLGPWGFGAAALGLLLAWAYSAPPLRLKRNGWWGNAACGVCYEGLAWVTGAAVMAGGAMPGRRIAGAGRALQRRRARHHDAERLQVGRGRPPDGHPLAAGAAGRGPRRAGGLLVHGAAAAGRDRAAAGAGASRGTRWPWRSCWLAQVVMMRRFLADPTARALWYSGFGVPLFVAGMMVSAFALRGLGAGA